ncbi:hypothetical protein IGI65_000374 [Enterococcus sp. DIV0755b]|uniref:TetR/AcrR family transcriptional regulator n=1 Tax=Enterococcus sp. DIV0755b TaxID=2774657 RepID=UPI003F272117
MQSDKDIRYYRTKQRITEAMIQLLKEKNFNQITVKNICEAAGISRSGFYLHYLDKYDLVEKYQFELMHHINQLIENFSKTNMTRDSLLLYILDYLKDEGQLLALLISDHGSTEIQNQIKAVLKKNALDNVLSHLTIPVASDLEKQYLVAFFSNALFGVLQEWVNHGQKESPEYIVNVINKIIAFDII